MTGYLDGRFSLQCAAPAGPPVADLSMKARTYSTDQRPGADALQAGGLLQSAFNALPAQIAILNRFGVIVDWNDALQRFLEQRRGWRGDLSGTKYSSIWHIIASKPIAHAICHHLATLLTGRNDSFSFDYQLRGAGDTRSFRLYGARFAWNRDVRFIIANEDNTRQMAQREREVGDLSEHRLALQEEERQRIAKELHDSTAQNLVAIGLNLMILRSQVPGDGTAAQLWNDTEDCLSEVLKEIRTITYLLYSPQLRSEGLRHSLNRFVDGFAQRTGLETKVRISHAVDCLPLTAQRSILRVVQEALSNVHRHAAATHVSIDLRVFSGRMHLAIADNGCGIRGMNGEVETDAFRPGVGLPSMRARLRELGGRLRIVSSQQGTKILAAIPIRLCPAPMPRCAAGDA